ncbi:hypothetical protein C0J52_08563 [Blattella germanica]|nr:hypothetical protein C0J52_08563 [Blattella germanica]
MFEGRPRSQRLCPQAREGSDLSASAWGPQVPNSTYGTAHYSRGTIDLNKKRIEWILTVPRIEIACRYTVKGRVLLFPIVGNGPANITLSSSMNKFLDENWRIIVKDIGPYIADAIGQAIKQIISSIASLVPYKFIFLE